MIRSYLPPFDPALDLVLDRTVPVSPDRVWRAWTVPAHVMRWFTPAPWTTVDCEIDLRPGGLFRTVMRSPEGQEFPNLCSYLDVIENERLIWTNAMGPGFRPASVAGSRTIEFAFTAIISLEPAGGGTRYVARLMHRDADGRTQHERMGFHDGWSKALEQLVGVAQMF